MDRLQNQIDFIAECDKLKRVERMTRLIGGGRRENSAEHSWDIALMAMVLAEHANEPFDLLRTLQMLLIHDLVEIDAGDTFLYDEVGTADKRQREEQAAERIFGMLPGDQAAQFRAIWEEFEERETPEARFAASVDRLTGMVHNARNEGGTWREHDITRDKVEHFNAHIERGSRVLADHARSIIQGAVDRGQLREKPEA